MGWVKQTLESSIGGKLVVALTGLGLVGFLIAHLSGNLLVYAGPEAVAAYAEGLRHYPALLWAARIGLIVMAVLHVTVAVRLNLKNRAARPSPYAKKVFKKASLPSRTMVLTGSLVLLYAAFHLAHFTFRATSPELSALGPWEVHKMIVISFSDPLVSGLYIAAMVVLGLHLSHGVSSVFQTLGWRHGKYPWLTAGLGPVLGTVIAAGFISIPVSVLAGILK